MLIPGAAEGASHLRRNSCNVDSRLGGEAESLDRDASGLKAGQSWEVVKPFYFEEGYRGKFCCTLSVLLFLVPMYCLNNRVASTGSVSSARL